MSADPRVPLALEVLLGEDEAILSFPLTEGADAPLTAAESEVLLDLLAGRTNAEIARARGRSARTVANQVASVLRKLGARSRGELVATMPIISRVR